MNIYYFFTEKIMLIVIKIFLQKKFPHDIAEYIFDIFINDYIKYNLIGKMFHLENVSGSFINKFNNEKSDCVYLNDYSMINNILHSCRSIFQYYDIIKNCNIENDLNLYFKELTTSIIIVNKIILIHSKNEKHLPIANYGIILSKKLDKIISKF